MFNNNLEWLEELAKGSDVERILENKAEDYHGDGSERLTVGGMEYLQSRVDSLLWAYRDVGYLYARLNPLGESYSETFTPLGEVRARVYHRLTLDEFGLSANDLASSFFPGKAIGKKLPLHEILDIFKATYCGNVGVEFLHIQNRDMREWLIRRMETSRNATEMSAEQKLVVLRDLIHTEELENFLHKTFTGQRRFSIEGAESAIPALHFLVDNAHAYGIRHIALGTTHRGRLTILNTILNKSLEDIFYLFEPNFQAGVYGGSGDVKYHIGYTGVHRARDGSEITISLSPNASHLESVSPVVEGKARGIQDLAGDHTRKKVLPVLIHGEAAFSGQGVTAETMNLSQLAGYATGGTIHIIINNQIGFTTPARDAHSNLNATDIAKMLPVPVFHVNGDSPEAVLHVMRLALDFRQEFGRDVVVDIICFRRHGHNEGDEPSFTHPRMYELIAKRPSVSAKYAEACVSAGIITQEEIERIRGEFAKDLKKALTDERAHPPDLPASQKPETDQEHGVNTAIEREALDHIAERLTAIPDGIKIHEKLKSIISGKRKAFTEKGQIDWAFAESMAFGSLLLDGIPVRLSGEDSERGTFSQRHLVWWDTERDGVSYVPLNHLGAGQELISAFDSPLAEFSVLGFEYGYASANPLALVMWEAQFGDFSNGGQVIIDNYIISGEAKWGNRNGLVLLLPHGFEGQGPEHSSAHLERFLQLAAQDNIAVANPTTPAQYFHLLRRQAKLQVKKPLVVMTPKSLLRLEAAVSRASDLAEGGFKPVLDDPSTSLGANPDASEGNVILCSGKVYYDLIRKKSQDKNIKTAIVRIEQLYPFPENELREILKKHGAGDTVVWAQEEPANRGAWRFVKEKIEECFPAIRLVYAGRRASASPAAGSLRVHNAEQAELVDDAFKKARSQEEGEGR